MAYGTPLHIHRQQYDVPVPSIENICGPKASPTQRGAAAVFVALVTLTVVLGRFLEYIYHVCKDMPNSPEISISELGHMLSQWEESLSNDVRQIVIRGIDLSVPGAANLRLAYLAVQLLLRRIQLDAEKSRLEIGQPTTSYHAINSQRAAEEIVLLVKELDESHLFGFWIPVNAFALTSATTLLLRSALRSSDPLSSAPMKIAKDMIVSLKAHQNLGWDLAENCLSRCGEVIDRIEERSNDPGTEPPNFQDLLNEDTFILDDFLAEPTNAFEAGSWDFF